MTKEQYINDQFTVHLHYWTKIGLAAGPVVVISLVLLDYLAIPLHFLAFLSYRAVTAGILVLLYLLNRNTLKRGIQSGSIIGAGVAVSIMVAAMIHDFGGHESPYFAGFIVIVIFIAGIIPMPFKTGVLAASLSYTLYVGPILIYDRITNMPYFLSANILIITSIGSILLLRYIDNRQLIKRFGLDYDRLAAEESLRQKEIHLQTILEAAADGLLAVDMMGKTLMANQRFAELWRIPKDILDSSDDDRMLRSVLDQLVEPDVFLAKVKRLYGARDTEIDTLLFKDGRVFERYSAPMVQQDAMIGRVWSFRDISDRKRAEASLRESEEFIRSVLNSVDEGFVVVGKDYRIVAANRAFCRWADAAIEDITGRYCYEITPNALKACDGGDEDCPARRTFETGEPHVAIHKHENADGNYLYVETKAFPLKDPSGAVTSVIETIHNYTDRYLLESEQMKSQKLEAIGILAGGIAHDFNNLLQGVFGYMSMARIKIDQKDKALNMLDQAERALNMSVNLTTQLLTFSKGGKPLKKGVALQNVIENSVRFALSGSRSEHRMTLDKELWPIEADEGQIGQVIQNIVVNAKDAMPDGGTVEISVGNVEISKGDTPSLPREGRYVKTTIKDSGIGIPKQHLSRIFDPYFTTKSKGSGLGLATSYSIIRNHNGMIEVASEVSRGSTFIIWLPASEAAESRAHATVVSPGRKGRVLVMDDEELVQSVAKEMIDALGHEVECADNGENAVEKFRLALKSGRPFDVVILDLTIKGGMGGEQTIRILREIDPDVKAIVSSGYADNPVIADYRSYGFLDRLNKPYNIDAVSDSLNALLQ